MAQLGPLAQGFPQGCDQDVGQSCSPLEPHLGEDILVNSRGYCRSQKVHTQAHLYGCWQAKTKARVP